MTDGLPESLRFEHGDVPGGASANAPTRRRPRSDQRRAQVTGGVIAAVATLTPIVLSVRGSRRR